MALLMSMTELSIDIMLPALPNIGATLGLQDANDLPLVVRVFMLGMAIGRLVWGPNRRSLPTPPAALVLPRAFSACNN
jgi:MFS transporter, DHA1 family, multidrug resistance protein